MQIVQIKTSRCECNGTRFIIGEREMRFVKSVDFHVSPDEVPTFKFETVGIPDIDVMAYVKIDPSPRNIQEACQIITNEIHKQGEFYNAFVASVQSVITEAPEESWSNELAERIVKRIFGEK